MSAETITLALILLSPLTIPAVWFVHFVNDPWPRGAPHWFAYQYLVTMTCTEPIEP